MVARVTDALEDVQRRLAALLFACALAIPAIVLIGTAAGLWLSRWMAPELAFAAVAVALLLIGGIALLVTAQRGGRTSAAGSRPAARQANGQAGMTATGLAAADAFLGRLDRSPLATLSTVAGIGFVLTTDDHLRNRLIDTLMPPPE